VEVVDSFITGTSEASCSKDAIWLSRERRIEEYMDELITMSEAEAFPTSSSFSNAAPNFVGDVRMLLYDMIHVERVESTTKQRPRGGMWKKP
jgi:hypothetical protein